MGFIKRNASTESARGAVTIIAPGNRFTGEMNIVGKLHVDGLFEGRIASLDTISVGKRGELHGHIQAQEIHVSGKIEGEINCTELIIENGGEVKGTVYCEELVIARKGSFVGERRLKSELKSLQHDSDDASTTAEKGDVNEMLSQMLDEDSASNSKRSKH